MIVSGGGMNCLTPATYFVHTNVTLQITVFQVRRLSICLSVCLFIYLSIIIIVIIIVISLICTNAA